VSLRTDLKRSRPALLSKWTAACESGRGIALVLGLITLMGCQNSTGPRNAGAPSGEIVVSAAVSLKEAFGDIARRFEAVQGVKVVFNFAGSGELAKQIEFGAPADVFASAGEREMDQLAGNGLIDSPSRADFAGNTLVLVVPASPDQPTIPFSDLAQGKFKRIAIGNPQTVPAGHYAQQALENNHLWAAVKGRLILAENVRQVLEYVARGEVDAGLVYSTDVDVAHGRVKVVSQAPQGTYGPVRYPIAIIKNTPHREAAEKFLEFVLGHDGQSVLAKHGFAPVEK
jgi:molybdate transport system substrate-binding protein